MQAWDGTKSVSPPPHFIPSPLAVGKIESQFSALPASSYIRTGRVCDDTDLDLGHWDVPPPWVAHSLHLHPHLVHLVSGMRHMGGPLPSSLVVVSIIQSSSNVRSLGKV